MKNIIWLITLFSLLQARGLSAQTDTTHSRYGTYFFDGKDVVFEFDRREYEKALRSTDSLRVDFADLRIKKVSISGNFNEGSAEGWRMKRIDENRFQLRKPVKLFTDAPNWQFRYIINGLYWTPPDSVLIREGILGWCNVQNPAITGPLPADTGNVLFTLQGFTEKKRVILAGSFNNWNEEILEMKKNATGWEVRISLQPGVYEYRFIVDGDWITDPANPERRNNQYGSDNAVLRVLQSAIFELKGFENAKEVVLSGSFNNWDTKAIQMHKTAKGWNIALPLTGGKHQYKFIVDDVWMTDPDNRRTEVDPDGNVNSIRFIH